MDFSTLLEDDGVPTSKKAIQELQEYGLDKDHMDLDMQALRDRAEIQLMQDEDPDELYELAWETASETNEEEEDEYHENKRSSSYFKDYDSDEYFSEDGSFLPEWEEYRPKNKPSILEKAARFLKRSLYFTLGIPTNDMTRIRWMKEIPKDLIKTQQIADKQTSNYLKTLQIDLINGLNRYNVNFDLDHKETSPDIVISIRISDKSRSTICIYASDDQNKSFQKLVRSRKSEMNNEPPKDLVIRLTNGLRLSSLNIQAKKSEIMIKIHDESWRKMIVMIGDHYPILRKTLRYVKLERTRVKLTEKVLIHGELSHGLTLSNTQVNCCYKRCPEVQLKFQKNGEPVAVDIVDDYGDCRSRVLNCNNSDVSVERISVEIPLEYRRINIRVSPIKVGDIDFSTSSKNPGECSVVLKILSKTNAECIIFDQDQEKVVFDMGPTDLQVQASTNLHYPPWEFQEDDVIHVSLPKGLYLNKNVSCDFLSNARYISQVQLKMKEVTPIRLVSSTAEKTVENFMEKTKETKKDEINIDLKELASEVSVNNKPTQDKEAPFGQVLTMDMSKLNGEGFKLRIVDDDNTKIQIGCDDGFVIVFRMDDMFKSDVFKILGVHGMKNERSTNITSFHGRLALKEEELVTIRVFDRMHVLENIINLKTKHITRDYYLRKTKDIKVDDHHCNLSIFLKNIACDEITLRCEHPDGIIDQNVSFSLIVTKGHPIKVLLSNDIKTLEHCYGKNPKPAKWHVNLTNSDKSKLVIMKISSGLSVKHVNFIWQELHCLMYDDLKQKLTIVILNEKKAKILLNVAASNTMLTLLAEEEEAPPGSMETIDLHLPFDAFEGRTSNQAEYSIFELDVYNNSPILVHVHNGIETVVKKMHVGVNVTQESRRTRAKFKAELQQLEEAFKFEITTRYTRQIDHCVARTLNLQSVNVPIEENLEKQSKEAMDNIWSLCPSTLDGKLAKDQACLTTMKPVIAHNTDEDFYDDIRSRLKNLKDEDDKCTIITGKQPSRHIVHIYKLLEAIDHLKPTPRRFQFEIDQKCFNSEDEALLQKAFDKIEEKILQVKEEIKPELLQEEDLTEDDLNSLEDKYRPLKGKLLHGSSMQMKGDELNHEDKRKMSRKPQKIVEEPIGTDCVNPVEEFVIVEMPEGISIEIEADVDAAFKYYSELIPNLKAFGQNKLGDQNIQHDEGNIEHSQEMPLVASEEAIPKEVCEVPGPESYTGFSEIPSTSAQQEVTIPQSTNATKVQYFQCDYCPQRTTGKNHLQNHNKNHNQLKKAPDFFCLFCGRGFKTNGWLKKHIEDRHKDKVVVYSLLNLEIIKLQN